jgi:hypothetical protein
MEDDVKCNEVREGQAMSLTLLSSGETVCADKQERPFLAHEQR